MLSIHIVALLDYRRKEVEGGDPLMNQTPTLI
jgi:hypothetical protein